MNIPEGFFDRFEYSINILKKDFFKLLLPFFLYNFISIVIIGTLSQYYMITGLSGVSNLESLDFFNFLNNSTVVFYISIGILLFIIYLLLYVVVFLGTLKGINDSINGVDINLKSNFIYGLVNFGNSMKTYWYIFAYVSLIPALFFIFGGILFNIGYIDNNFDFLKTYGLWILGFSLFLFIIFSIYRGIKSSFGLYSAVNENDYSKSIFLKSVTFTDGNWYRILGNLILLGIFLSLITGIITGIYGLIAFSSDGGITLIENLVLSINNNDIDNFKNIIMDYLNNFSILKEVIGNIFNTIIQSVSKVFGFIFIYIFYLRLKNEYKDNNKTNDEQKVEL